LAPEYPPAYKGRAVSRYGKGELESAIADASEAIRLNPKLVETWVIRAIVREKSGSRDQAIADYKKALELDPTNALAQQGVRRLGG
jgi:tetratricopeptide (TPR) repeat protein